LNGMRPLASCRRARWFFSFFDQRMRMPRLPIQPGVASLDHPAAGAPAAWVFINGAVKYLESTGKALSKGGEFDPEPWILLNLIFSGVAFYTGALVIIAQKAQTRTNKANEEAAAKHNQTTWPFSSVNCAPKERARQRSPLCLGPSPAFSSSRPRRLGWAGAIPTTLMRASERPKLVHARRRPIFAGAELEQTIAAAREPYKTLFTLAALTRARVSELCGLTWADVRIDDLDDAEVEFGWQVDRRGTRRPTKTDGSARTVPIPRGLATLTRSHSCSATVTRT
jgi:integrase